MVFLFCFSLAYSALASLYVPENRAVFLGILFLNALITPFVMALVLYLASLLVCRGAFGPGLLFRIMAFAQVTLLLAWIPGLAWVAGLWKFFLIGLGMVKVGRVGTGRVLAVLLSGLLALLLVIRLFPSLFETG